MNAGAGPDLAEVPVDALLERLESAMARLADGSLPLDELLRADEEQWKLVDELQTRLRAMLARVEAEAAESAPPQ